MNAIILNEYGEYLNSPEDAAATQILSFGCTTHGVCGGFADLRPVSKTHQAFHCRICNFRFVFPIRIVTWLELRLFVKNELKEGNKK